MSLPNCFAYGRTMVACAYGRKSYGGIGSEPQHPKGDASAPARIRAQSAPSEISGQCNAAPRARRESAPNSRFLEE
jgi:hypothetical protein